MTTRSLAKSLLAAITLSAVACATVTRGTTQSFAVISEPEGATVTTSNGLVGKTPATLTVSRKSGFNVHLEKDGFAPVDAWVGTEIRGSGGAALAGNILVGGLIGASIDSQTGAMNDLVPNPLVVKMIPINTPDLTVSSEDLVRALEELKALGEAVVAYRKSFGRFPDSLWQVEAAAVRTKNPGMYDLWGTPYQLVTSSDGKAFFIVSAGADRRFDESTWAEASMAHSTLQHDAVVVGNAEGITVQHRWVAAGSN